MRAHLEASPDGPGDRLLGARLGLSALSRHDDRSILDRLIEYGSFGVEKMMQIRSVLTEGFFEKNVNFRKKKKKKKIMEEKGFALPSEPRYKVKKIAEEKWKFI